MLKSNRIRQAILGAVTILFTGCTSIPITSYPKLASLDPETLDLKDIEIAVRMQDDFGIQKDGVVLFVALVHEETGDIIQEQFILTQHSKSLTPFLQKKQKRGYTIHRFRMNAATSEAAIRHRARILSARDAEPGKQHKGTFSANAKLCQNPTGNPFKDPRMTLFLRTAPDEAFFTMIKETKAPLPRDAQHAVPICLASEGGD